MDSPPKVIQDLHILPSYLPIPSFGLVPVNAFVLKAKQPVLIDTGLHQDSAEFMDGLRSVIECRRFEVAPRTRLDGQSASECPGGSVWVPQPLAVANCPHAVGVLPPRSGYNPCAAK
jgi:hypothetical protein